MKRTTNTSGDTTIMSWSDFWAVAPVFLLIGGAMIGGYLGPHIVSMFDNEKTQTRYDGVQA